MMPRPRFKSGGGRLHLLLVDEVEPVRRILAQLLQRAGYEVETAADATEALRLAGLMRWDALVLDIDLPGMNGVELYARILLEQGRTRLPAVFSSSQPQEMLRFALSRAHWVRLLRKPCGFPQLLEALENCLRADGRDRDSRDRLNATGRPRLP